MAVVAPVAEEYFPSGQEMHTASDAPAVALEYLPAPQSVHCPDPVDVLYLPAEQSIHLSPVAEEYFPSGQSKHAMS